MSDKAEALPLLSGVKYFAGWVTLRTYKNAGKKPASCRFLNHYLSKLTSMWTLPKSESNGIKILAPSDL